MRKISNAPWWLGTNTYDVCLCIFSRPRTFTGISRKTQINCTGIDEKGYDAATGKMLVCVNPQWFRPTDVDNLWGDPTKAKTVLGWNPQSTTYEQLVEIMAKHDRERAKREKALKNV